MTIQSPRKKLQQLQHLSQHQFQNQHKLDESEIFKNFVYDQLNCIKMK